MAGATLLHLLLLAALGSLSIRPLIEVAPQAETSVDVQLLTPREFDTMTQPRPVEAPPSGPAVPLQSVEAAPPAEPGGMVKANRMMATDALAHPLSRQAREMLPLLAADERAEQLCGLEAMSQIHAWKSDFEPDRVTAYAKGETKLTGRILIAESAAFRSKRRWYDLNFRCEFSPDQAAVLAFEFRVGEPVPRSQWAKLGLPERY
ncbi:DUF930 domain-containing protein [Bosea sp. R86505]|uniref:DUF930 domain-containing protein n=1 Tax=Bosea sp. R86505 TaxID=3101710 RepID=UPI0036735227